MESKKYYIKQLIIRTGLIFITITMLFFLLITPLDIASNFSIYLNRNNYKQGTMEVENIYTDSFQGVHLTASGSVNNIKTVVYLGLERDTEVNESYPILYRPDGKSSFLITKNFKFNAYKFLIYGIIKVLSIPIFVLIIFKIYKYFKNDKLKL